MIEDASPWLSTDWQQQTQRILKSYRHWLGQDLIPLAGDAQAQAQQLFESPFVLVSHGMQTDPILNYGNRTALMLWEMDLPTLLQTPSRFTAEPVHREERAELLERTTRNGYVDDYSGIRVSRTGRRFRIDQAIVWNLMDEEGGPAGQAATFSNWVELPSRAPAPTQG